MVFRYRQDVLNHLAGHGIVPKPTTSPQVARGLLNEIYRYELRRLRDRLLLQEFPTSAYLEKVVEIRNRTRSWHFGAPVG